MNFNKTTGIIEMFMDLLEVTDEGTFTFNLVDGKATGRTSLVLIGEGEVIFKFVYFFITLVFLQLNGTSYIYTGVYIYIYFFFRGVQKSETTSYNASIS